MMRVILLFTPYYFGGRVQITRFRWPIPQNGLVCTTETGVINGVYMRDKIVPYLVNQLQKVGGDAIIITPPVHTLMHLFPQLSHGTTKIRHQLWWADLLCGWQD